ncbi:hypothetical protein N9L40_02030 [Rhodobacteraceae bacterium]|nr:hypothetical protein [Paracoccaceae bacterium]
MVRLAQNASNNFNAEAQSRAIREAAQQVGALTSLTSQILIFGLKE